MRVIQVIPLFGTSSESAADYFNRHQDEIGAITGNHLIVALPDTVLKGDNGDVYSETNKEKRYPGLTNADLPCLWVESQEGHLVLSLPTTKAEINKLLAVITQAAKDSKTWPEFEQQLGQRLEKHLPGSALSSFNPLAILRESVHLVPGMRYAFAVLGLVAVVAIVAAWRIDFKVAVFGALIILGLMIPVLVFARMTTLAHSQFVAPAKFLMWVFVILCSVTGVFLLSAAAFRYPPDFARLLFGDASVTAERPAPRTGSEPENPPTFESRILYTTNMVERIEYVLEPGRLPADRSDEFLVLHQLAYGTANKTNNVFKADFIVRNVTSEPLVLDLSSRYFSMTDDQGRSAVIMHFCCAASGVVLSPRQERTAQLFFLDPGWHGKNTGARALYLRVTGFSPVQTATWQARPLATAN